jgi:hypothetical protein
MTSMTNRTLRAALAASVAAVALIASPAGAATGGFAFQPTAQSAATGRVVEANAHARVVKTPAGVLVAESLTTGKRTVLGRNVAASLVDIDRHMVGYARAFTNRVEVRSIDARTGKVSRSSAAENVMALQVRRTGTLVWITEKGTQRSVYARTFPTEVLLGSGEKIDPRSLAIADSDATTAHVYWVDGTKAHVAAVE